MTLKVLDIFTSSWVIRPDRLENIRRAYKDRLKTGDILNAGAPTKQKAEGLFYQVDGGIATIPLTGILTKNRTFLSELFGGSAMREIGDAFDMAIGDPSVKGIILSVDSPGGTVDGTMELAEKVAKSRGIKPIMAWADGMMASGAYWIGAAADKIYISGETTVVGSIGVVATHIDVSEADKLYGEKWTEITAGKYKRIASVHRSLSDEGREYLQEQVDHIYSVFVDAVATYRGRPVGHIIHAADGQIFLGKEAVEVGLVDGIMSLETLMDHISTNGLCSMKAVPKAKTIESFEDLVEKLKAQGFTTGKAIMHAARQNPPAHADYIQRAQVGATRPLPRS